PATASVAMKPATMPLPIRSVLEMSVRMGLGGRRRRLGVAPLGVEESVLSHQTHFGFRAALRQFARGLDREQHRFGLALVGAELFVGELDHPVVVMLDQEVSGWRHAFALQNFEEADLTHGDATHRWGEE